MCRKKKIKCDGRLPSCSHCENYKTECVFTQVEKKRAPPKGYVRHVGLVPRRTVVGRNQLTMCRARAKYIEGLENRLGRMEHLLRLSGKETTEGSGCAAPLTSDLAGLTAKTGRYVQMLTTVLL